MNILKIAVVAMAALLAGACAERYGPKETAGMVIGGAAGGLAGSQIGGGSGKLVATGVGTLLGALVGSEIGRSLDRADRAYLAQAQYDALEYRPNGQQVAWRNPDSGNYGYVQPVDTYQSPYGQYCREYQQTVYIGGRAERAYGTACRESDGSWRVVN